MMQQAQIAGGPRVAGPPNAEHDARPRAAIDQGSFGQGPSSPGTDGDSPASPRRLTLTNWNASTDAISVKAATGPSRTAPEQAHGLHNTQSSMSGSSSGTRTQAGPAVSQGVIMHTDGGTVRQDVPATDIKEIPAEAPPAYSG